MFSQDILDHFWSKVDKTSSPHGHWLWTGSLTKDGYGQFCYRDAHGKWHNVRAHRFALSLIHGPLPKEVHALHKPPCVVRHCVRHLYPGTPKENGQDTVAMGRSLMGEKHHQAKLTEDDILIIRQIGHSMTQKAIGKQFHVTENTIAFVQKGLTWQHVPGTILPSKQGRSGFAKLSDEQVREIRSLYTGKYGQASELARIYHVSRQTIWTTCSGKYYQDV